MKIKKVKSKNLAVLNDFITYVLAHPEQRFWQSLTNWANASQIHIIDLKGIQSDTFYFEGKDK